MLQNFKNFIELLKLPPAILSTISLATGLILFLPDSIIKLLYMSNIKEKYGLIIGIFFLLSTIMLIVLLINYCYRKIKEKITNNSLRKMKIRYLKELDANKTNIIKNFIQEESHSLTACMNDANIIELSYYEVVSIAGRTQFVDVGDDNSMYIKYFLQPWVLKLINQNEELKNKFL